MFLKHTMPGIIDDRHPDRETVVCLGRFFGSRNAEGLHGAPQHSRRYEEVQRFEEPGDGKKKTQQLIVLPPNRQIGKLLDPLRYSSIQLIADVHVDL